MSADPGSRAVVPFTFDCHRCGRCCTHGDGHVWLEDGEAERMADALGVEADDFERRHVRTVTDPRSGELRRSLRQRADGRCELLEGTNVCSVYDARPRHCADFPYWPSVLEDEAGFARAQEVCPGITVEATAAQRAAAIPRLAEIYAELQGVLDAVRPTCIARGVCCRFEEAGHELYATALEADYAAHHHPEASAPEADGRCPYHVAGRCTAREGRPLGCRTYFCDRPFQEGLEALHEGLLGRIRSLEAELDYPRTYARFPDLLRARGIGAGDGLPGPQAGDPGRHDSGNTATEASS